MKIVVAKEIPLPRPKLLKNQLPGAPWILRNGPAVRIRERYRGVTSVPVLIRISSIKMALNNFDKGRSRSEKGLSFFVDGASAGIRMYRERGFGAAIRAAYDHLDLTIDDLQN